MVENCCRGHDYWVTRGMGHTTLAVAESFTLTWGLCLAPTPPWLVETGFLIWRWANISEWISHRNFRLDNCQVGYHTLDWGIRSTPFLAGKISRIVSSVTQINLTKVAILDAKMHVVQHLRSVTCNTRHICCGLWGFRASSRPTWNFIRFAKRPLDGSTYIVKQLSLEAFHRPSFTFQIWGCWLPWFPHFLYDSRQPGTLRLAEGAVYNGQFFSVENTCKDEEN